MRVLVIEDDITLGHALQEFLLAQGHVADWVQTGRGVVARVLEQGHDLLLLDLNLPDVGGQQILQSLRRQGYQGQILILTANDGLEDRVAGLDAGADDYVTKPFELAELAARVRVLARRSLGRADTLLECGALQLDTVGRQVSVGGRRLTLSVRELSLLEMLMARPGQVVTKQQMVQSLSARDADFSDNAVEVYVYRLRKHLDGTGASIQTIRGFGYLLDAGHAA
ncbi:response regulator [Castellaniella sp.]|uniref:response regulator n=1 Tax=Castellaniella sp. TaxID=1955812 RepID=UPI0035615635